MTAGEKILVHMQGVYKKTLDLAVREKSYYYIRYHKMRAALFDCRLEKIELESMVDSLQKQLGDKGLDINLGNDMPDVL